MITSNTTSLYTLIDAIAHRLQATYHDISLCKQYAWWMIEAITQTPKTTLLLQKTLTLTSMQAQQLEVWTHQQIEEHIPLQYLIGSVPFGNCTILVKPPILIPRPETEEWCYALITQLQLCLNNSLRILDLCTGSGCIAIALAKALPHATIYATDISSEALALAQQNAIYNKVQNITFIQSDLFDNLAGLTFDIIIANPPYISADEWHMLDRSVRAWEDKRALIAPDQGTGILHNIIKQAPHYLKPHPKLAKNIPHLVVEIGHTQGHLVKNIFCNAQFQNAEIKKDSYDNDRIVVGFKAHEVCS